MLHVAYDGRNSNHGQIGFAGGSCADRARNRDDVGLAAWSGHLKGIEARDLQVDGDLTFGRRDQSRLDGAWGAALDGNPLLAKRQGGQQHEHEGGEDFSHEFS